MRLIQSLIRPTHPTQLPPTTKRWLKTPSWSGPPGCLKQIRARRADPQVCQHRPAPAMGSHLGMAVPRLPLHQREPPRTSQVREYLCWMTTNPPRRARTNRCRRCCGPTRNRRGRRMWRAISRFPPWGAVFKFRPVCQVPRRRTFICRRPKARRDCVTVLLTCCFPTCLKFGHWRCPSRRPSGRKSHWASCKTWPCGTTPR